MKEETPAIGSSRPCRILVVDDERHIARFLDFVLTREGYTVKSAHDGGSALDAVATFRPDALLLDLGLPDISGLEILRTLRRDEKYRDLKVLVLTARSSDDLSDEVRQAGADAHATKPIAPSALCKRLLGLGLTPTVSAFASPEDPGQ